jgi:mRNA interferase MazF
MEVFRISQERSPRIGDVYLIQFTGTGSEQSGWRPGVVFQNNTGNAYSPNIIALPMTTSMKKLTQPTHVLIRASLDGLRRDSVVLCENPERVSKSRLGRYLTSLSGADMERVAAGNLLASAAIAFLDLEKLRELREEAVRLNDAAS